jgi:hypothetical protein
MVRMRPFAFALAVGASIAVTAVASVGASSGRQQETVIRPALPYRQVAPALLPNSKENTSVIAQNNGTAPATIAMDIYTPQGVLIPTASRVETNVPADGTRTFPQAINSGLTPGFRGVGVLSSDQPINALLVRDIEQNGTARKSYSVHNAYGTGGNTITLPYVSNNLLNTYQTRFAIANTGTAVACVTIAYAFDGGGSFNDAPTGQTGCATGHAVPVGGQIAFGPTAVSAEATQAMPSATAGKLMSATVNATGAPVTVAVDAYVTSGERKLGSYDGFIVGGAGSTTDDVGLNVSIPLAARIGGYYSQILISNPNPAAATVQIAYKGNTGNYNVTLNVPANGTNNHSVYAVGSPIPEGFVGAATLTSDQPIAAVLFRAKKVTPTSEEDEDLYTAVSGVPTDRATTTAKFPLIFRRIGGTSGCASGASACGYNTWVSVAVADGGSANLTITSVTDTSNTPASCGAQATYTTTKTISGSFVFYQNLDGDNGLGANPACLWAGMKITSDKPIIAIADVTNDLNTGDNDGLYNAFGS